MTSPAARVALVGLLLATTAAVGQPPGPATQPPGEVQPPAPPAPPGAGRPLTQAVIDEAVDRGVSFLRQSQNPVGSWGKGTNVGPGGGWAVGYTALCGIALVEAGVPPSDPGLQKAATVVRAAYPKIDHTYEAALAIIFLDRMGEKKDKQLIQGLALRLIAGQTGTGGWGYKVPIVTPTDTTSMYEALKKLNPPQAASTGYSFRDRPAGLGLCIKASDDVRPKPPAKGAAAPAADLTKVVNALAARIRGLPVYTDPERLPLAEPKDKRNDPIVGTTDNSNTHFATIGLWCARRHDVPTERTFALLNRRFRSSQADDGSWGYDFSAEGKSGGSSALTCVALLGLAIGHALDLDKTENVRPEQDPKILKAFKMLGGRVGAPTGFVGNRPSPKDAGGLYYLWALERIAVLYDVNQLDNKDWYKWGAEILCTHQKPNGSWEDGGYHGEHPSLNTALAVLFLKRANLTPDLSKRLLVDPSRLTATVNTPTPAPPPPPPPPTPTPEPTPPPKVETPAPTPAPKAAPPPEPVSTPAPAPKESSNLWLWLGLGGAVLLLLLGLLAFLLTRSKPEEKPRKKGKKAARRRDDDDDDDDDEEEDERPRRRRK